MDTTRKDKGRDIAFNQPERVRLNAGTWHVLGRGRQWYQVDLDSGYCACPDKTYKEDPKHRCKHWWSVWYTAPTPIEYKIGQRKNGSFFIAAMRHGQVIEVMCGSMDTREEALEAQQMLQGVKAEEEAVV